MALNHSVGKKESNGKRCLPAYKFYLPIGFLISFAVFFLGRIRYEQSRTLYLQYQSQSIETEFLEWLSLIQLFICVLVATSGWKSPSNCSLTEDASPKSSCALSNQVHRFLTELKTKITFEDLLDQRQEQRCNWQLPFLSHVVENSRYKARRISER